MTSAYPLLDVGDVAPGQVVGESPPLAVMGEAGAPGCGGLTHAALRRTGLVTPTTPPQAPKRP